MVFSQTLSANSATYTPRHSSSSVMPMTMPRKTDATTTVALVEAMAGPPLASDVQLEKGAGKFLEGRSAPDFAAMDFEVDFKGRAVVEDLTDLGRAQMGF